MSSISWLLQYNSHTTAKSSPDYKSCSYNRERSKSKQQLPVGMLQGFDVGNMLLNFGRKSSSFRIAVMEKGTRGESALGEVNMRDNFTGFK